MAPANAFLLPNVLGILGHGIGHGAIAASIRHQDPAASTTTTAAVGGDGLLSDAPTLWETLDVHSILGTIQQFTPFVIFWIFMLKAATPKSSTATIIGLAIVSMIGSFGFPTSFGFTYVQSVLFAIFSWDELWNKPVAEKQFEYALYPWIVGLPLAAIGWMESTQCSKSVIFLGGHLIYDSYIPLSIMLFYMICWLRSSVQHPTTATSNNSNNKSKSKVA